MPPFSPALSDSMNSRRFEFYAPAIWLGIAGAWSVPYPVLLYGVFCLNILVV